MKEMDMSEHIISRTVYKDLRYISCITKIRPVLVEDTVNKTFERFLLLKSPKNEEADRLRFFFNENFFSTQKLFPVMI